MEALSVSNISTSNKIALKEIMSKIGVSLDRVSEIILKTSDKETIEALNEMRCSLIIYSQFIFELIENTQKNKTKISDYCSEIVSINEVCKKIMSIDIDNSDKK